VLVSLVVWMKSKHRSLAMTATITAFATSPDRGKGLARDMQVRWALEEVGQPYDVRLVSFKAMKEPAHRAVHPFGQIPTYEDGELALFESGAILIHLAEQHRGLLPEDPNARARAIMWMFAAVDTLKAPIIEREAAWLIERDKSWFAERQVMLDGNVRRRLGELSVRLGDADWLDGDFSAADVMMVGLLRRLETTSLLDDYPNLLAYVARGKARPAFKRAFEAQYAVFNDSQPAG
jgi:glutathione S-transferase